jgi:nitroreductase
VKTHLTGFLQEKKSSPMVGTARFELIEMSELESSEKKQLGTYGFIKGARYFIAGASVLGEPSLEIENYGYLLETIILKATDLGLGTCWIGGSFKKSAFSEKIRTAPNETVPAITPLGHRAGQRLAEKVMKWSVKAKKRQPWSSLFFEGSVDQPLTEKKAGKYAVPLEMVRLGPSAANAQPWRVIKVAKEDEFNFFIKKKKGFAKSRTLLIFSDLSRLDIGIAICHFDLTAKELKLKGKWSFDRQDVSHPDDFRYVATWTSQ